MSRFYVAALTGRSGTGKSYAGEFLRARGVPVIDGDAVAREVVQPGTRCLHELAKEFGRDIVRADGSLDRHKLADLCFSDPKKKEKLDDITHPFIIERMTGMFDELKAAGHRYCIVEAPAVIESGLYLVCDRLILITADEALQVQRIVERDGLSEAQARTRLAAQKSEDELRRLSDLVIDNSGTRAQFDEQLTGLVHRLGEWFGKDAK